MLLSKEKLNELGLTVKEACEKLGISRPTFYSVASTNLHHPVRWVVIVNMCKLYARLTNGDPKKIYLKWAERNWHDYEDDTQGRRSDGERHDGEDR